ncbi:tRNA (adenosine(37)-N6)-threonylcarbamoyltransferase complex transferase subunit TsaD [Lentilactobacillus sp. IMAU92037]|uniref:tRNA (adenosine(37)-N6)-threonylcarbamoyltransferase complex transferase subunit TsaD n=1 Tax=Lentilactobacillus TaxID=2767893 RepID=UPI001C25BA85|nr:MULTISPECIES: tRNA (adenosine(37)-N6)-threonylcarbamoyltransferase complex transferase subunit TsaD [Lentilactobacillus]MBU9789635.1 tRNA (adenosine(37)-N6)-threonylcarbamoyltransferase complex transferase subunit TsaD [Lentilactobacillus dabitei]MBV0930585.1 tRNA (adenosine(37)-N6)-threonylcarbamoyltransferase complex transferase subunit TsaD [Lentilactobacillus dabitei]MDM7515250.1 tRNA (adenosine(37)-N6)-threonylcarbamoyltransferase complex transferase subunit TsaD [Lentilactobacillus sp. 
MNLLTRDLILSFESSCDETSVAVIENGDTILSNIVATQIKSHQRFGGVVPEVASRHHIEQITGCIKDALKQAKVSYDDLTAVAVTYGPGLVGALLIGVTAAKAVAWAHHLPLIPVNHLAGHIYAAHLVEPIEFPAMALVVSGGHTELVYMPEENRFEIIGETRDDAAGEAYDKIGRVLGINYPAGKPVDEMAHRGHDTFDFPRAMDTDDNFDFSFSGLKSAFINTVHHADQIHKELNKEDLAASFQQAVVDVLSDKTVRVLHEYPVKQLILAGGVAANRGLRDRLTADMKQFPNTKLELVPLSLCGDNAAMIGAAGEMLYQHGVRADATLNADPGLEFDWIKEPVK